MEIKNNVISNVEEIEMPNDNVKCNDEKGIVADIRNYIINSKIGNIIGKRKQIKKKINKTQIIQDKYQQEIRKVRKKFVKKIQTENGNLKELEKEYQYLTEIQNSKDAIKLLKDPLLLLIRQNKKIEIYQKIKTGWFLIPSSKKKKMIYLDVNNTNDLAIGKNVYKTIVHHEDETFDYPTLPMLNAEQITAIIELTWAQAKDEDNLENKKKLGITDWIIYGVIGLIIVIILIKGLPMLFNLVGIGGTEQAVSSVVTVVHDSTGAMDMNTLPIALMKGW